MEILISLYASNSNVCLPKKMQSFITIAPTLDIETLSKYKLTYLNRV